MGETFCDGCGDTCATLLCRDCESVELGRTQGVASERARIVAMLREEQKYRGGEVAMVWAGLELAIERILERRGV